MVVQSGEDGAGGGGGVTAPVKRVGSLNISTMTFKHFTVTFSVWTVWARLSLLRSYVM